MNQFSLHSQFTTNVTKWGTHLDHICTKVPKNHGTPKIFVTY
jgi:hypothetical protein